MTPLITDPYRFAKGEHLITDLVGLGRLELPTSRLSSARSNQLSYKPGARIGDRSTVIGMNPTGPNPSDHRSPMSFAERQSGRSLTCPH